MLGDAVERENDLDLARRCIDLAARLEAPVCRIFAWSGRPTDALIDRFIEACRPAAEHAALAGILLGFPTHHDLASDPASCRRLVDGFGRDRAGIIFNGQSLEIDGIAPVTALRTMSDIVVQAELKDWLRAGGHHVPTPIGLGDATVWPVVEALDASGFEGWLTLHHLKQHHSELPELERGVAESIRAMAALRGLV
jgi:sugar phosphate isomerase/epimerase